MTIEDIPSLDNQGLRKFGLTTGLIFGVLFGLFFPWVFDKPVPLWPWAVCGTLALWALVHPASLLRPYRIWMRVGMALGFVNSRIILGAVFYLMCTPISLVLRVLGKDPLDRKLDRRRTSYRKPYDRGAARQDEPALSPRKRMEVPY